VESSLVAIDEIMGQAPFVENANAITFGYRIERGRLGRLFDL
jgi:hypothetical protein